MNREAVKVYFLGVSRCHLVACTPNNTLHCFMVNSETQH